MTPGPTLAQDLMDAAVDAELAASLSDRPTTHRLAFERAARLRAAATRLAAEMRVAERFREEPSSGAVHNALLRINGGPLPDEKR